MEQELAVSGEQRAGVEVLLRGRTLAPRVRERLEMVKAIGLGQDVASVARWSGRCERTIRRWVGRFLSGGATAVQDAPRPGRPPLADAAYLAALTAAVQTPPPRLGLAFDVWTSDRLAAYLEETTGKRIAPGWLRALLARQDFACGRPKHTLGHLQDPDALALGEQALAEVGGKGGRRPGGARVALPG